MTADIVTEHAAAIAKNLRYWRECGASVVRRDSEIADEVARKDIAAEQSRGESDAYRRKVEIPRQVETPRVDPADIARMAWYDDQGFYEGPEVAAEISDEDRRFAQSANGAYFALCKERTGEIQTDEQHAKHTRQSETLFNLSEQLCAKMATAADPAHVRELCEEISLAAAAAGADRAAAAAGFLPTAREVARRFNPYRETGFELRRYFIHSRQEETLPNYRRIRFIPYVAQSLRAPMVSALDFWLSKNPFARFWTFTSGVRVQLSGVRDRSQWLHNRLRKLNAEEFMQDAGVQIVFRSTEMGTPETNERGDLVAGGRIETDDTGQTYFHVHAHCVVELTKGFVATEKWENLLERVHRFWRHRWQDDGAIASSREVCKYVTKPAEMLKLSAAELVELQEQLSGTRLIETMGSLRAEINARQKAGKRLIKRKTPDGRVYVAVHDWNRHQRRTKAEAGQDAAAKLTPKTARGAVRIMSRGAPRFGRSKVAEPCVTVMCMRGSWSETAVRSHPLVAPLITATVHEYFEGVARRKSPVLGISVHTRTPTVLTDRPQKPRGKPKRHRMSAARAGF